jgi:putative transposase
MYKFIQAEKAEVPVAVSCRALEVSRSAYYRWTRAEPSERSIEDQLLSAKVRAIHTEHKGRYGSPRIHRELRERGDRVGRKRVARLMSEEGLRGRMPRRFRRTTDSRRSQRIAPNILERNFKTAAVNQAWVGDVTYIPTRQGWLYLAVLLDLYSRRVVGWAMSDTIDTSLVLDTLAMAIGGRLVKTGLIHHTDRDRRYASDDYRKALERMGITASMSRKADCWDNAVAESFFATLEKELLDDQSFINHQHGRIAVTDYIENYYNSRRRHSYLDYRTPLEYEMRAVA